MTKSVEYGTREYEYSLQYAKSCYKQSPIQYGVCEKKGLFRNKVLWRRGGRMDSARDYEYAIRGFETWYCQLAKYVASLGMM